MKRRISLLCLLLALCLLCGTIPVTAAEYTYIVRLYAGNCGTLNGQQVVVYEGLHYGERISFRMEDVQLAADSKYYVRGFRESGRDNDTVDVPSFVVTKDRDYVVAYGVRGELVAYTVRYLDENGRELHSADTFYGNVGDKPVMAFRFLDGYQPNYYNITKTLSENAAENVFTFTYRPEPKPERTAPAQGAPAATEPPDQQPAATEPPDQQPAATEPPDQQPAATEPPAQQPAATDPSVQTAGPGASASGAPAALSAPAELLDLDLPAQQDGAVGEAAAAPVSGATQTKAKTLPVWAWVLLGAAITGLFALLFALLLRTRKKGNRNDA